MTDPMNQKIIVIKIILIIIITIIIIIIINAFNTLRELN